MTKTNTKKRIVVAFVVFSMLAMYGYMPVARASSLKNVKDTISDSDRSAVATHQIQFRPTTADLAADQYVRVTLNGFTGISQPNVDCPSTGVASTTGNMVDCTGVELASTSDWTLQITNVTNPGTANYYLINVETFTAANVLIDTAQAKVYIIDDVMVTARVDASLNFQINQVDASTYVNGVPTTGTGTPTAIAFGGLSTVASSTIAQELTVSTNASQGYVVTVQQDAELTSAAGININSFDNSPTGTGSTSPHTWNAPLRSLGAAHTYGHMGLTSDDASVTGVDYTGTKYVGLNSTNPIAVMSHNGPADGSTQNAGKAKVAYSIQITDLQEAGDYTGYLTYIATPTY